MMATNFFSNLDDVVVAVNDLLQFKVIRAVADVGRIVVNTTIGLYGLVDVASHVGLQKHNEDFGQTLGFWGVGNGPYLVLPILGPSTVRDGIGVYSDSYLGVSKNVDDVEARNQLLAGDMLDARARLLHKEDVLGDAMLDRYSFIRDAYLQHRLNSVYDGNPPRRKYDDEESDDGPPE
jgi:phospholipid-binding lipoprotein MlaA